ncbi:hypothetical protein J3458_001596 [Metarhizium acridum]|uniref:uncharacterized protein n=1 Tax=Metarhizium acridum TaxID=92637 RepID=UPI001C6B756B|nr:hypothetical protein J3458_001596 [Metarhizium acridum]
MTYAVVASRNSRFLDKRPESKLARQHLFILSNRCTPYQHNILSTRGLMIPDSSLRGSGSIPHQDQNGYWICLSLPGGPGLSVYMHASSHHSPSPALFTALSLQLARTSHFGVIADIAKPLHPAAQVHRRRDVVKTVK